MDRMLIEMIPDDSMDNLMSQVVVDHPGGVTRGAGDDGDDHQLPENEFVIRDDSLEEEIRNTLVEWGEGLLDDGWELQINGDDCWETPRTASPPLLPQIPLDQSPLRTNREDLEILGIQISMVRTASPAPDAAPPHAPKENQRDPDDDGNLHGIETPLPDDSLALVSESDPTEDEGGAAPPAPPKTNEKKRKREDAPLGDDDGEGNSAKRCNLNGEEQPVEELDNGDVMSQPRFTDDGSVTTVMERNVATSSNQTRVGMMLLDNGNGMEPDSGRQEVLIDCPENNSRNTSDGSETQPSVPIVNNDKLEVPTNLVSQCTIED